MKTNFRLIGDVHGHYEHYLPLLREAQSTIQIGDLGLDYTILSSVDAKRHRVFGGNHDNYDTMGNWPHFLGDYGVHTVDGFGDIFFIRGGISIDRHRRKEGVSWWEKEELSMAQCYAAINEYKRVKPKFVLSHECPQSIVPSVTQSSLVIPSRTKQLLEEMFAAHQPERWVFGHYHTSWNTSINNTLFTCLDHLECLDF